MRSEISTWQVVLVVTFGISYEEKNFWIVNPSRVRNLEYESTAMNDFMCSVKHCTQVLIVGAHCVDRSCTFADSDVIKKFRFRSNFGHETFPGSRFSKLQLAKA